MLAVLVNALTLAGLACGACGVALLPGPSAVPFLLCSLAIDALDGWLARKLGVCTSFGAWLDWCTDTGLAYAMVFRMLEGHPLTAVCMMSAVVVFQATSRALDCRWSGRTMVTAIPVAIVALGYAC